MANNRGDKKTKNLTKIKRKSFRSHAGKKSTATSEVKKKSALQYAKQPPEEKTKRESRETLGGNTAPTQPISKRTESIWGSPGSKKRKGRFRLGKNPQVRT